MSKSPKFLIGCALAGFGLFHNLAYEIGFFQTASIHSHIAWASLSVVGGPFLISNQIDRKRP